MDEETIGNIFRLSVFAEGEFREWKKAMGPMLEEVREMNKNKLLQTAWKAGYVDASLRFEAYLQKHCQPSNN